MVALSQTQSAAEGAALRRARVQAISASAGRIAHELNNQLTVLLGHLDLALLGADAASRHKLASVRHAGQRITKLVGALERLSTPRRAEPRSVDLISEVRDVVSRFAGRLESPDGIRVVCDLDALPVTTDPRLVYDALVNILANAVQATEEQGHIDVTVIVDENHWHIRVSDDGPGFDDSVEGRAFDPLVTTRRMPGSGLGLSHALLDMAAIEGDVVIESSRGRGAQVTLSAPREPARGLVDVRAPRVLVRGTGTVLVVDDAPVALMNAYAVVAGAGYKAVLARGFSRALDHLTQGLQPDLILSEAVLYDGGAGDIMDWLAKRQQSVPTIAAVFAGEAPPVDTDRFEAVVTKPFDAHSLTALMAETLASRRPR